MILINAENHIMGRLGTFVAKKALEGEQVTVVNAEKIMITGTRENALAKMRVKLHMRGKGNPEKGPKYSRMPDKILRLSFRGMLPWRSSRGKEAFRKIHVYNGMPEEYTGKEFTEVEHGKAREVKTFVELGTVCKLLGAKW